MYILIPSQASLTFTPEFRDPVRSRLVSIFGPIRSRIYSLVPWWRNTPSKNDEEQGGKQLELDTSSSMEGTDKPESAPNVSLNLHGGSKIEELYFAAACGILLQFGVLAFSGLTVYYPQWNENFRKNGEPVRTYAFVLFALGTIILVWGVIMCSMVIERSTK